MLVDIRRREEVSGGESWEVGIDMVRTGERIRLLCEKRGLTVKELQKALRIGSFQSIYAWLSGRCLPNLDNMYRLSRILGVPMEEIIVGQERMPGMEVEVLHVDKGFSVCRMGQYGKEVRGRWRGERCQI